jgi:hypothetical protein
MGRRRAPLLRLTRTVHRRAAEATALRAQRLEAMANRKAASVRHPSNTADHRPLAVATALPPGSLGSARRKAAAMVNRRKAATADRPSNMALRVVSALPKIRTALERWCRWVVASVVPWARSATR